MSRWNQVYAEGSIHTKPSKEIVALVPRLRSDGVVGYWMRVVEQEGILNI